MSHPSNWARRPTDPSGLAAEPHYEVITTPPFDVATFDAP